MAIIHAGSSIADVHGSSGSVYTTASNLAQGAQEGIIVSERGVAGVIELPTPQSTLFGSVHTLYTGMNIEDTGNASDPLNWLVRIFNKSESFTNALFQFRRINISNNHYLRAEYWDGAAFQTVSSDYLIPLPTINTLYRIDWEIVMSPSLGIIRWYWNGVKTHEITTFNTVQTSSTTIDRVSFHEPVALSTSSVWSNFILATEDTRDLVCVGLYPDGNGAASEWNGNYQDIDEFGYGTDFISSTVADQRALFTTEDIPSEYSGERLRAVVQASRSRVGASGPQNMRALMRMNGVIYQADTDMPVDSGMQPVQHVWDLDPSTDATWSQAALNAAQHGLISKA